MLARVQAAEFVWITAESAAAAVVEQTAASGSCTVALGA